MVAICEDERSAWSAFHSETKTPTSQFNSIVVSKYIWLKFDFNHCHAYFFEKRSLNCQCSTGVGSNITVVRNQLCYDNGDTAKRTNMSRFHRTTTSFLNLLDLCLTPVSSLKTSSRSDLGRLLINTTSISAELYRVYYFASR